MYTGVSTVRSSMGFWEPQPWPMKISLVAILRRISCSWRSVNGCDRSSAARLNYPLTYSVVPSAHGRTIQLPKQGCFATIVEDGQPEPGLIRLILQQAGYVVLCWCTRSLLVVGLRGLSDNNLLLLRDTWNISIIGLMVVPQTGWSPDMTRSYVAQRVPSLQMFQMLYTGQIPESDMG